MSDQYEHGLEPNPANHQPLTPIHFLFRSARVVPERVAVVDGAQRTSYRELADRCVRLASSLARIGIGRGDTVSMLAPNSRAALEAHFAVPMLGAVLNMLNIRLDAAALGFLFEHAATEVLLVDASLSALARDALAASRRRPRVVLVEVADVTCELSHVDDRYEALVEAGDPGFQWPGIENEWQAICLNYTSGTTGDPKGVVYHHRGACLTAMASHLGFRLTPYCVYLWTLPMFHCNGWSNTWAITSMMGTHVCLRRVDAVEAHRLIDEETVTHLSGAPIVLQMLLDVPAGQRRRSTHPVSVTVGGAAPPAVILERMEALGFEVNHGYGLTETYGPAGGCEWRPEWDALALHERARIKSRQGVPSLSLVDMTVRDPVTLAEVPRDASTMGEVMMRGNSIMKGYLRNPSSTTAAFAGGWFRSGDLGVLHPDGYVEIRDRAKDIIISGGENISSLEVEQVLYRHPAVLEVAVVAREDETWGEVPWAFVALRDGQSVDADELIRWCRDRLAHFKVPRRVVFGDLPKTSTGKIQKHLLREAVRAGADQRDSAQVGSSRRSPTAP